MTGSIEVLLRKTSKFDDGAHGEAWKWHMRENNLICGIVYLMLSVCYKSIGNPSKHAK